MLDWFDCEIVLSSADKKRLYDTQDTIQRNLLISVEIKIIEICWCNGTCYFY